ncbi:MAG: hypothetical protein HKP30_16350 [Myxococcales bacterium]|nr:hypothetical protein [Myxococcales bacterium]
MSEDATPSTAPDAQRLQQLAEEHGGAWGEHLGRVLGHTAKLSLRGVESLERDRLITSDEPIADLGCWLQAPGQGAEVHLLLPQADALRLAALQMGDDPESVDGALDAERCAGFRAVASCLIEGLGQALEAADEGTLEVRDAREVPEPATDPTWLIGDRFLVMRLALEIEGLPACEPKLLFPDADAAPPAELKPRRVCFLDDSETSEELLESLAADLDCQVEARAPSALACEEGLVDLAEFSAIVVPWDVDGRSGIELVEALRRDPRTESLALVMASESPSRARVAAALAAGADSFALRPYSADELRMRLEALLGPAGGAP